MGLQSKRFKMADSAFGHAAIVASFLTKTMDTTKVSVTETLFSVAASQVCVKDVRPACSQQANASEIAMAAAGPAELVLVDSCTSPDSQQRIVHRQHDVQDQHRDRQLLEREREREREQEHARSSPAPHNASSTTFAHVHCEEKEKKRRRCDRYDSSESSDSGVASLTCSDASSWSSSSDITEPVLPASPPSSTSSSASPPDAPTTSKPSSNVVATCDSTTKKRRRRYSDCSWDLASGNRRTRRLSAQSG